MSYRDIPEDKILKFPATPGFKGWTDFFTNESTTHPAKMNLRLLSWILETFTKPGDVILDPMAGTGSTIVLGALIGRHTIAVEYEPIFCDMIRDNIKRTEPQSTLTPKGRMTCIQGDARELSKLLEESDAIITSPPFGPSPTGGGIFKNGYKAPSEEEVSDPGLPERHARPLSDDPRNIDNLKYGKVDAVITSPPYEGSRAPRGRDSTREQIESRLRKAGYSEEYIKRYFTGKPSDDKMKGLGMADTYKVEAVFTSPPYGAGPFDHAGGHGGAYAGGIAKRDPQLKPHSMKEGNIGNLSHGDIDAVVASPPYGNRLADDVVQDGDEARMSYRQAVDSIVTSPPYEGVMEGARHPPDYLHEAKRSFTLYSEDPENIGSMKGETYLEAMLQVYRECHKVLKNKGVMVLVTKNFIRDKKVVRLDLDTIKLCEVAGFTLSDRWYFKLPTKSFWRLLYRRKYPDVPGLEYEDVLVFTKEGDIPGRNVK